VAKGVTPRADATSGLAIPGSVLEDLDEFRLRARDWLATHMPVLPMGVDNHQLALDDDDAIRARELQRTLYEGGFAGLCFPVEYGGQGLTGAHQEAFNEESISYEMPTVLNVPTLSILAPTLLDFGTEDQKKRHIPAILRGDEIWVQFLSEPGGGSDLAGLLTRATLDGDVFMLNGSKLWSSGAYRADYALCLARTDWAVPKHRGLTMFIVKIHQPGIDVQRIKMVDGSTRLCQEFFDNVTISVDDIVGEISDGWTVASCLLNYERAAAGGASPYTSGVAPGAPGDDGDRTDLIDLVRDTEQISDPRVRQLVAEAWTNDVVRQQLIQRVLSGIKGGQLPETSGSLLRLCAAVTDERHVDIGLEIASSSAGAWSAIDAHAGVWGSKYLFRQAGSLAGGSNEMQRNIISERVLGMPREYGADRGKPFDEVQHNS
jgi:alkylation response protein AidB-like acyl-CoA dehydrogenase